MVKAAPKPAVKAVAPSYPVVLQGVTTFDGSEITPKISIFVCPNETEPGSFLMKAPKGMNEVTVKLEGDLTSGKSKLPVSMFALSVVDGDKILPVSPIDLQSDTVKRYWISMYAPNGTAAGTYTGAVVAIADGKVVGRIPLEVKVLPIRLVSSSKQYGMILPDLAECETTPEDRLNAIKDNGFKLISTSVPVDRLSEALRSIKINGFGSIVPYTFPEINEENVKDIKAEERLAGATGLVCCAAIKPESEEDIESATETMKAMRKAKLTSLVIVDNMPAYENLAPSAANVFCNIEMPYIQGLFNGDKPEIGRREWYYWDITGNARINRLNSGYLLWKSGLFGVFPTLPEESDSIIGTIRWEALREGVDDTRYITTMMQLLREAKDLKKGPEAVSAAESYLNAVLSKPLAELKNNELQAIRWQLAQHIIKLQPYTK